MLMSWLLLIHLSFMPNKLHMDVKMLVVSTLPWLWESARTCLTVSSELTEFLAKDTQTKQKAQRPLLLTSTFLVLCKILSIHILKWLSEIKMDVVNILNYLNVKVTKENRCGVWKMECMNLSTNFTFPYDKSLLYTCICGFFSLSGFANT